MSPNFLKAVLLRDSHSESFPHFLETKRPPERRPCSAPQGFASARRAASNAVACKDSITVRRCFPRYRCATTPTGN